MRGPLEITFGKSSSAHYAHAVQLAQSITGYRLTGQGNDLVHAVTVTASLAQEATWQKLQQLLRLVSSWHSVLVTVAGQPVPCWTLAGHLVQVKACYARKVQHGAGSGYCSGKDTPTAEASHFGCRFCKGVSRRLDGSASCGESWIQFGTLSSQRDAFRVDKAAIRTTLERQTQADACLFCPAFRWRRVRAAVDDLPEVIQLGGDSPFAVKYSTINPKKALGIQPKQTPDRAGVVFGLGIEGLRREVEPTPVRSVPKVRYADIAGQDAALAQLKNVVELPLRHAAYFEALRVEPQRGILLYGPPGNGKTLLAKAVATECHAHFELLSGPEILGRWVGQSEENLRRVFARARQLAPSVVLIDELDSLAPRRERLSQHHWRNCSCSWTAWRGADASPWSPPPTACRRSIRRCVGRGDSTTTSKCRLRTRKGGRPSCASAWPRCERGPACGSKPWRRRRRASQGPSWRGCAERQVCTPSTGV
jgi:hypothetical protein